MLGQKHTVPIEHGMDMTCAACGEQVTDERFLGGFAKGVPNMILHRGCVSDADKARLLKR
jgi:hypothetical protein